MTYIKTTKSVDVILVSVENGFLLSDAMLSLDIFLAKAGIKSEIIYPRVLGYSINNLVEKVRELNPKVVALGGLFADRFVIKRIIEAVTPYRKDFKVVVGGNLVTPIAEFMLDKLLGDIAVIGEGELIFTELVSRILSGQDYFSVGGIVFRHDDQIVSTGPGEYIEDLGTIPSYDYDKVPMEHFIKVYKFYKYSTRNNVYKPDTRLAAVSTGRGCPYKCNFCYHYNKSRLLDIPSIIDTIKELKSRYNINMLKFLDDLTLINKKRSIELCDSLIAEIIDINYSINAHFHCLDDDIVKGLKQSGCVQVGIGLESGSQVVLNRIGKGVTIEQIKAGIELFKKYKINWNGSIQIGQLDETEDDIRRSRYLIKPYIDEYSTISVSITTPYPGSPLYNYGLKTGIIKDHEQVYKSLVDLRTVVVNFSRLKNWKIRYMRLKLAFEFDLKKQKAIAGPWVGHYILAMLIIAKVVDKLSRRIVGLKRHL